MYLFLRILFVLVCAATLEAQTAGADVIIFTNGDRLAGHFVRATGASLIFHSDILGDLTVDWAKVRELRTSQQVAVIRKGVELRKNQNTSGVPQGTMVVTDRTVRLTPPQTIPVNDAAVIIDEASFQKAMTRRPSFFSDWKGGITAGATIVQATQNNRTFTGAVSLVRTEPAESWLEPRNRTSFSFAESYGQISQPGTPTIKTSILHFDAERDEYLTKSIFGFGEASFDHNYSQGLDLQQTYNGGIGWSILNTAVQSFDVKASMSYIRQQFATGTNQNLIGSVFAEHYGRKLARGMTFDERGSVTPAWNNTSAYSAAFSALLTLPVYRRLSGSAGIIDTYLNDPPVGFNKNSFQFTLGVTYALP